MKCDSDGVNVVGDVTDIMCIMCVCMKCVSDGVNVVGDARQVQRLHWAPVSVI